MPKILKAFARTVGSLVLNFNFGFWTPCAYFCVSWWCVPACCWTIQLIVTRHPCAPQKRALLMAQLSCRRVAEKCKNRARISTASLCCRLVAIDRSRTIPCLCIEQEQEELTSSRAVAVHFASNPGISAGVEL